MGPKIGSTITPPPPEPVLETPAPDLPAGQPTAAESAIHGYEMEDLEDLAPQNRPPDPPDWLLQGLTAKGLMYRWLSTPQIAKLGKRGYTMYSPNAQERNRIDRGDCPPGVHVDETNTIRFRDDAMLGTMPKRHWEHRRRDVARRTVDQTGLSLRGQQAVLAEKARQHRAKLTSFTAESWDQKGE